MPYDHVCVFAGRWFVGMAIVNLGYLANAWVYLMDKYVHFTLFF